MIDVKAEPVAAILSNLTSFWPRSWNWKRSFY